MSPMRPIMLSIPRRLPILAVFALLVSTCHNTSYHETQQLIFFNFILFLHIKSKYDTFFVTVFAYLVVKILHLAQGLTFPLCVNIMEIGG